MELWSKAQVAWENRQYDAAKELLEQMLATAPHDLQCRHFYGVVLTQVGCYEEAITQLQIVCDAEMANDEAWSDLANAQHLAGRIGEAESSVRSGIARHPDNLNLCFNLGVLLSAAQRTTEAEAAFLKATELDRSDQASWMQLGLLRYARSDHLLRTV